MLVHVVAWQYNGGAGFDWYLKPAHADKAYQEELANCKGLEDEGWSAYRFDFQAKSDDHTGDAITEEIDAQLDDLCAKASIKHENVLSEYGKKLSEMVKA